MLGSPKQVTGLMSQVQEWRPPWKPGGESAARPEPADGSAQSMLTEICRQSSALQLPASVYLCNRSKSFSSYVL